MSWVKTVPAAEYFGVSVRTFRDWLKAGFPHSKTDSGTILVELSQGDEFLRDKAVGNEDQQFVNEIIRGLK